MGGFQPLDFLFDLGNSVLLVNIVFLDAAVSLASILVSLLFIVTLVAAIFLVSFLAWFPLKVFNFMKQPFDRPKIIYHVVFGIVQKVKPSFLRTITNYD